MIDQQKHRATLNKFWDSEPFPHQVLSDFWNPDFAQELCDELPLPESDKWNGYYNNAIEYKKTLNEWDKFDTKVYQAFTYLCSRQFTDYLSSVLKIPGLEPDVGLHGGGLHYYPEGGKLNPHIDYSHHPKLGYRRKVNILIYMNPAWKPELGGQLGLWTESDALSCQAPAKLIEPEFNTAVIFENTTHSYHGLASPALRGRYSLAMYYLVNDNTPRENLKANFLPTVDQKDDAQVQELINLRKTQRINTGGTSGNY